jgi:hypothetical protein
MQDKRDERPSVWPDTPLVTPWDDVLLWSPPLPVVDEAPPAASAATTRIPAQRSSDVAHANGA